MFLADEAEAEGAAASTAGGAPSSAAAGATSGAGASDAAAGARARLRSRLIGRLQFARGARQTARVAKQLRTAIEVANPGMASAISRGVFGLAPTDRRRQQASSCTLDPAETILVDKSRQHLRLLRRGVVSHVHGVQLALQGLLQNAPALIHAEVYDDCTLWCKQPTDELGEVTREMRVRRHTRKPQLKGKRQGKTRR